MCDTYNPNIEELNLHEQSSLRNSKQYWLNHLNDDNVIVYANSGLGGKCKVEIISKSELLTALGSWLIHYKYKYLKI